MQAIILASQSPRRREALALLGLKYTWIEPKLDETLPDGILPQQGVQLLAIHKAQTVSQHNPDAICIGADTMVVHRGQTLGKPVDEADAYRMLRLLQNDRHDVYTGLCVCCENTSQMLCDFRHTVVRFLPMKDEEILAYIKTGEPMDKAGSYGIQGRAAAFIHDIVGSYDNVVGLPLALLKQLLAQIEVDI